MRPARPLLARLLPLGLLAAALLLGPLGCAETDPTKPATWIGQLGRNDPQKVADAVRELRKLKATEAVPAILPLLKHDSIKVREEAAYALMEIGDKSAVEPLIDAIDLASGAKGITAANTRIADALGELGDAKAVPALLKMAASREDIVRLSAVGALGKLRDPRAISTLVRLADDSYTPPLITKKAIVALGDIRAVDGIPTLLRNLVVERNGISFYPEASYALFQIGAPAIQPLVEIATAQNKEYVAWAEENQRRAAGYVAKAADILADLGEPSAIPVLLKLTKWEDPDGKETLQILVRGRVASALGRLRAKEGAAPIAAQLDIEEANIREQYAYALALIGDRAQLPKLEAAAKKGSWTARKAALTGLALLGDAKNRPVLEAAAKQEQGEAAVASCMKETMAPTEDIKRNVCAEERTKRPKFLQDELARLDAGEQCKSDGNCWLGKLKDGNAKVRERAAFELGKLQDPAALDALVAASRDDELLSRRAAFIALDWFANNPQTRPALARHRETLAKQLEEESGRAHTRVVNEDLKRVVWKISG